MRVCASLVVYNVPVPPTWNSLRLCGMFIFSINPCTSIIKSSIKSAWNDCRLGRLAFPRTRARCCFKWMMHVQLHSSSSLVVSTIPPLLYVFVFLVCCYSVKEKCQTWWSDWTCLEDLIGSVCCDDISNDWISFFLNLVYTEANPFPRWKQPVQQAACVFHLLPVVLTFQQIGLHVLMCVICIFSSKSPEKHKTWKCGHLKTRQQI